MSRPAALEWAVRCEHPRALAGWTSWSGRPPQEGRLGGIRAEVERALTLALGPPRLTRLYAGCEFCARRLPPEAALGALLEEARSREVAFTFLAPPSAGEGADRLPGLLRYLGENAPGSEVVFQDWELLEVLNRDHPGLVPVLGRTLVRRLRDLADPECLDRGIDVLPRYREFLRARGVERVEIDTLPDESRVDFRRLALQAHLCLPFTLVAAEGACPHDPAVFPTGEGLPDRPTCRQDCRRSVYDVKLPGVSGRLLQRGQAAMALQPLSMLEHLAQVVLRTGIRRLVYDPEAGF